MSKSLSEHSLKVDGLMLFTFALCHQILSPVAGNTDPHRKYRERQEIEGRAE